MKKGIVILSYKYWKKYWQERFTSFHLDIEHLISEKFPEYISDGGVPKGYVGDTRRFQFPTHVIN